MDKMGVLQFHIPNPARSSNEVLTTSASAGPANKVNGNSATSSSALARNTPSPGRSVVSSSISSTPVTSNLGSGSFSNARADNSSAVPAVSHGNDNFGSVPVGDIYGIRGRSNNSKGLSPATMLRSQGSASSFQMQQMRPHAVPSMMQTHHVNDGGTQQKRSPPDSIINTTPPWNRMGIGGPGMVAMQGGRLPGTQPANFLGTITVGGTSTTSGSLHNDVGSLGLGSRNVTANSQSANMRGKVNVGGTLMTNLSGRGDEHTFGTRSRHLNAQSTNLGTAMAISNINMGDKGRLGNRGRLAHSTNLLGTAAMRNASMAKSNVGDGATYANRNRLGRAPPRHPTLPLTSTSLLSSARRAPSYVPNQAASGQELQYPQHRSLRVLQSAQGSKMGVGALTGPNSKTLIDYDEYHDMPVGTIDFSSKTAPFMTCVPEVALSSGLVTLSVHEAISLDGAELALHPDIFSKCNGKNNTSGGKGADGKEEGSPYCLRPGDLVEIRVWCARPGVSVEDSSKSKLISNPSISKSKIKSGLMTSLHSRNTSLATVSSFISNTSLTSTARSLTSQGNIMSPCPPLPKVVGGDGLASFGASPGSIPSEAGKLYGENLIASSEEAGGEQISALHGKYLLEQSTIASNLSSVFASATSSLFRKMAVPTAEMGSLHSGASEDASSASHGKDGSIVTNSTMGGLHSRDSSLIPKSASWMSVLNSNSSREETPQISPMAATMEPVVEGLPQPHPLITNLSQHGSTLPALTMRRGGPPHPLSSPVVSATGAIVSQSSTSSSHPSSPKNSITTPISTPPASSLSTTAVPNDKHSLITAAQRPMLARTQSTDQFSSREEQHFAISSALQSADTERSEKRAISCVKPNYSSSPATPASRKIVSTTDAPTASSGSSHGEVLFSNTRNRSTTMIGASAAVVPTHRWYLSNAASALDIMPSSLAGQTSPSSAKGTTILKGATMQNDDDDSTDDINDILQATHFVRVSFCMAVSEKTLSSIKSGARTQVSLLRQVADLYSITAYDTVTVTQIPRNRAPFVQRSIAADFLTMTFKDQNISRGDMYNFQKSLLGSWVYEGKRLTFNGMRTNTKVILQGDHVTRSGFISEDTKLTFRTRSARIIWLVQMSSEMWDFASPYEYDISPESSIYFDKFVQFVRRLFDKWKKLQLTHNLTVVFFSRTYIRHQDGEKEESSPAARTAFKSSSAMHIDPDGRMFEDQYKIVVENETNADYKSLIHRMKKEFVHYPKGARWNLTLGNERTPSTASSGNVLEAINITLNLLHLHYIDRDLHRTGNSIVIITAGNGVFEIDKNLAGITKQRMMDNGIGSDMLSLGLPPLHVAPFFLFKEKSTSSAEEIQGFDDWKTYFEVPHWMNLSFVDYDKEEEPMLYKEHLSDHITSSDAKSIVQSEDDTLAQPWHASNGYLKRNPSDSFTTPNLVFVPTNLARQQYKHLISGRDFEDILWACRPRNLGEYGSSLPLSLAVLLKKDSPCCFVESKDAGDKLPQKALLDTGYQKPSSYADACVTSQRTHTSRPRYLEWGAINFDELRRKLTCSLSGSQSSPSSSFASSMGSYRVPSQLIGVSHLQSTTSLDGGACLHKKHHSDDSMTTVDNEEVQEGTNYLHKMMSDHDKNTFSSLSKTNDVKNNVSQSLIEGSAISSINESFCPGSPMVEGRGIMRSQSAMFPVLNKGGIEAALLDYSHGGDDITRQRKDQAGLAECCILNSEEAVGRSSLAVSPLSIGMPFSLDRRNEGLRPSVMRLVVPEAIPRTSRLGITKDGLQLDSHGKSVHHLSQVKTKSKNDAQNGTKASRQISRESIQVNRRNCQRDRPKDNNNGRKNNEAVQRQHTHTSSPQRAISKKRYSRKRYRRKLWVLNPFRQEDEDEVLTKRTHNRRRWSHVFPPGEDEFKRHAGPNWKSLCQPAILPMTIDFHPSPQDLEDQAKFSVRQYSVTLPPMGETTYKSHKELLDDLVMQRMRQDFQIVPRSIIQPAIREAPDNVLEATLSMGHKIQRLSYNPSTDSVDVVQYYARFAEDETPQTYRYLLWSALLQDYVSVFQTFTKYTLPYEWNRLDMLISGDSATTITEGMRNPRISFVIIPDPFSDSDEEYEYVGKFKRLVDYFSKIQQKDKPKNHDIEFHLHTGNSASPQASTGDKRFIVDLRKKRDDKYEWMELVHDSNCDTRRTFRLTIQWLVAVASKIDQQAVLLHRRCAQFRLKLVSVPHYSCLASCFMNPFAVPIKKPIRDKTCVDTIENALTTDLNFVYDGNHMSDPNEIDCLDGFDFLINKWSIKKKKRFVPARQYLHRSGTLFTRFLRDTGGKAIIIIYLNQKHISGDERLLQCARAVFHRMEQCIADACKDGY